MCGQHIVCPRAGVVGRGAIYAERRMSVRCALEEQHAHIKTMSAVPSIELVAAHGVMRRDAVRGAVLLHPTDFTLYAGQRAAVTGPSGSGKSVFLRTLALLDACDAGYVTWRGARIARARIPAYRRRV